MEDGTQEVRNAVFEIQSPQLTRVGGEAVGKGRSTGGWDSFTVNITFV